VPSNNVEATPASARIRSRGASPKDGRIELPRDTNAANLAVVAIHNQAAAAAAANAMNSQPTIHSSQPTNLSEAEILYRQRLQTVSGQYAAQMAMANVAAAAAVHLPVNTTGHQVAHTVNSHRILTTPQQQQQLTIYGPNGQPGIHTQFPAAMVGTTAGVTNSTVRAILPRAPIPTGSATQLASVRHNLPQQIQPQRHPFR